MRLSHASQLTLPWRLAGQSNPPPRIAARLGMVELLLSGVTTCADHHYLYHAHGSTETGDLLFDDDQPSVALATPM